MQLVNVEDTTRTGWPARLSTRCGRWHLCVECIDHAILVAVSGPEQALARHLVLGEGHLAIRVGVQDAEAHAYLVVTILVQRVDATTTPRFR